MPTKSPRLSVIMIFLNAERFIDEAVQSVLSQRFDDYELILADDGSTTVCADMARGYAERFPGKVSYIDHEGHRNRGMSATRNLGLSVANGEFVAFIDSDDVWHPSKLEEQVAIMDAYPEVGMVCGAVCYWRSWDGGEDVIIPTGHVTNAVSVAPETSLELYPLGTAAAPCPSDILLRRDVAVRLGGFEEHFTGARQMYEDQGFLSKLYLESPVYFSDRVWLHYRQHEQSCVSTVAQAGLYHDVRAYFLSWFGRYLQSMPNHDPRVAARVRRAIFYERPIIRATSTQYLKIRNSLRQTKQKVARKLM
jgi:glycosyltransferase involved in cell wall biosynthesis